MCSEYLDSWKDVYSIENHAVWAADDVVSHLKTLENAKFGFKVTDSYRNKVSMLSARAQRIAEEIAALDPEKENL